MLLSRRQKYKAKVYTNMLPLVLTSDIYEGLPKNTIVLGRDWELTLAPGHLATVIAPDGTERLVVNLHLRRA